MHALQKEEDAARDIEEGVLMESWPEDSSEGVLASALRAMFPFGFAQLYPDGKDLVLPDEPFHGMFQVETGLVEIIWVPDDAEEGSKEDEVMPYPKTKLQVFI